ncbi:MAG: polysaccharide deacetylase family protein [Candidatus Rifleibacteriota bacterium]
MNKSVKKKALFSILIAVFLVIAGLFGFYLGWKQIKSPIMLVLTFHGVTDTPTLPWEIKYEEFKAIIEKLLRHDYQAITPQQFEQQVKLRQFEGRKFLISFDDGLKTSAEAIKKLFQEKGISSAFFIITDEIGKENYVSNETLADLQKNFNCRIGLHGKRHYEVTKILAEGADLSSELELARMSLSTAVSNPVTWYAYPFGEYNASAAAALASTGLELAFTVDGYEVDHEADLKLLPRLMYLRGASSAGAPDPLDWAPPQTARYGSLTITLSCMVIFISLSWIIRAKNLLHASGQIKNQA